MAIRVTCACGKSLRANDDAAGKRVKCPACGVLLVLPASVPVVAARPPRKPVVDDLPPEEEYEREEPGGSDMAPVGLAGLSNDYTINMNGWFRTANAHCNAVLGPMIGYMFIFVVILFALMLLSLVLIGYLGFIFLLPQLAAGPTIVCLAQLKGEKWTFGDFFGGFRRYGAWLALELLLTLLQVACLVPGFLVMLVIVGITQAAGVGKDNPVPGLCMMVVLLLSVMAMIYVWFRTAIFARQLMIDRGCGAVEAIKGCWQLTRGHFWGLFGIFLLLLLIYLAACAVTCGIASVFAAPYILLVLCSGYQHIAGSRPSLADPSAIQD